MLKVVLGSLALLILSAEAANPIVHGVGLTDPHAHVFKDRVFLYASHDFSVNST